MGTYTYPGVYIQEVDTGNKPIEGVSTSIAGFLGIAERGPMAATFLSSFADYQRNYGTYYVDGAGNPTYLAYAVEGFFLNGGQGCWVARVASATAVAAQVKLANITISAAGPGATGAQIGYSIQPASIAPADTSKFQLQLYYWPDPTTAAAKDPTKATMSEVFDNLSTSPTSSMFFVGTVNSGSNLVTVTQPAVGPVPTTALTLLPSPGAYPALVLGDFMGSDIDPANPTGLAALDAIDDISIYCCPDEHYLDGSVPHSIAALLLASCENLKDRFAIFQSSLNAGQPAKVAPGSTTISQRGYAAFYYPWVNVANPTTNVETLIPPGGHIAGIYARSDANYNVAKDPANEQISGIDSLQLLMSNATQGQLNPIGVNCLRYFKAQGNLVYGGRTTSPDPDWVYINIRRLFIFIEKSIQQGTQWVVFQPNDQTTWARVIRSVSDFLTGLWMQNMLMGATKDQAFFVRCDMTTMTQTDIESGRLIVTVGVAPVYPAEFVIFQIGQWSGGASVTEIGGNS
jgi:phage tail sheath protein FI